MDGVIEEIRAELSAAADPAYREGSMNYFKEDIICYGVRAARVNQLAREYFPRVKGLGKEEIFALCEQLFASGYQEEAGIAADWSHRVRKRYQPADFETFERWVDRYLDNWAKVDIFCSHTVGSFVVMYPEYIDRLKGWTESDNRWVRRAAAVSLIVPARRGEFLADVFDIADRLLTDPDDLVQKGYGWMLKEASKPHRDEVFGYVMRHRGDMPRTSLRYAIEKMPPELRKSAMEKP